MSCYILFFNYISSRYAFFCELAHGFRYSTIYAYGDSSGDKQMLAISDKPFYKQFI